MSTKLSVTAILLRMDRIQQLYKAAAEDVSLPANVAVGTGAGIVGGLGSALHSQLPALREMRQLKEQIPHLLRLRRAAMRRGLLGAGVGAGAGLLSATSKGYFDKETDDE